MMQPLYIHAATAISPQHSFDREHFLKPAISSDSGRLYALDAPYADYISPVAIRRMSRILKITISTAMHCLKEANIKTPDAIITGTGRGGVTDMEVFVKDMIRLEEGALNPTAFIQSTYNSPNGWIAMQSGCTNYNQTYVHRGCSFELALLDAQMLLSETDEHQNILVGCYDEMTEDYFQIRSKRGYWKQPSVNSATLLSHSATGGTIGGEGAAFFLLNNEKKGSSACIQALTIVHNANSNDLTNAVAQLLKQAETEAGEISLVLTGLNGDCSQAGLYEDVLKTLFKTASAAAFKQLSGEYDTATGFALWLANYLINQAAFPNELLLPSAIMPPRQLEKILIINHFIMGTASAILISR
jgi:hypothetical protein